VTVHYDSLLAKVITWGATREEARQSLVQALNRYDIEGVTTNLDFVNAVLNHPSFAEGDLSTGFIARHMDHGAARTAPPVEWLHSMAIAAVLVYHNRNNLVRQSLEPMVPKVGPPHPKRKISHYVVKDGKTSSRIRLLQESRLNAWTIGVDDREYKVITPEFEFYRRRLLLKIEGERQYFRLSYQDNLFWIAYCGIRRTLEVYTPKEWNLIRYMPEPKEAVGQDALEAPMPGLVVKINVREGDRVYKGQDLVIIECMKMQTGVSSPCNGLVASIGIHEGQAVEAGDVLVTFERK